MNVEMLIESRTWTARGEIVTDHDGGSKEDVRDDVASTTYVYRRAKTHCLRETKQDEMKEFGPERRHD